MTTAALDWPQYLPVWDEPVAEGLQGAACSAPCKRIATCAVLACARGKSAEEWRRDLLAQHHREVDVRLIKTAEDCMRASGLWPWNDQRMVRTLRAG